jgi:hypothetical protein
VEATLGSRNTNREALGSFFGILGTLAVLSLLLGFSVIPEKYVGPLNIVLDMVYLGVPLFAIYRAASADWTRKLAFSFLIGGAATWAVCTVLSLMVLMPISPASGVTVAISQIGIQTACVGLGAVLATSIKDKNILIPIAIFLALYDIFLVRTSIGPTHQMLVNAPEIFQSTAVRIPAVTTHHPGGIVQAGAYVGDADIVSLAAFFVALYRFRMRTRATFIAMVPTLIAYLLAVVMFGLQLPALFPIGAVILIVNFREFHLTKDEKISTGIVAALAVIILAWGLTRPKPVRVQPVEPLKSVGALAAPTPRPTPPPKDLGQRPSATPPGEEGT